MNRRIEKVDEKFDKVDDRLVAMSKEFNDRFDRLNGSLLLGALGIIAELVGNFFF
jgi:hypothetical protein